MKTSNSLRSQLESATPSHLITHIRQNSKNEVRTILTQDPASIGTTRKEKILHSFANKKIAAIVLADLEKIAGKKIAAALFNEEEYQHAIERGLTVHQALLLYTALEKFPLPNF